MGKIIFSVILFLGFSLSANGQVEINFPKKDPKVLQENAAKKVVDLNGLWEAEITQLSWQGEPAFQGITGKLHVEVSQQGNRVEGLIVCRAKFADNMGYLSYEKTFKGKWDGETLQYEDVKVENYINTHRKLRHIETCLKTADLSFYEYGGAMHLEGNWEGSGHISEVSCSPGKIHLKKILEEDIATEEATTYNVTFSQKNKGPVELKWDGEKIKKIKNRKVKKGEVISVKSKNLSITVYDHQRDDGDIVSLNYNGNWLLEKYTLKNTKHKMDVFLDGQAAVPNYLVLYAHNLGEISPNTVAIIVDDGVTRQQFVLNADMNTSDVIYFKLEQE